MSYETIDSFLSGTVDAATGNKSVVGQGYDQTTGQYNAYLMPSISTLAVQIVGTFTATFQFEATVNGTTWTAITGYPFGGGAGVTSATAAGTWFFAVAGYRNFRVRCSVFTSAPDSIGIRTSVADMMGLAAPVVIAGTSDVNVKQLNGTTTDTNSGVKSAGTLRTVTATDQPQLTNPMLQISGDRTDLIYESASASLTPKFAIIDAATSGDNTLVTGVSTKKIRVLSLYLVASAAVNVRFESAASGTALSGQMNLTTNSGFTLPYNPKGWFQTVAGELLNLELSGAVSVDGGLVYVEAS